MDPREFAERTKQLGLRVIRVCEALPSSLTMQIIAKQLLRCGTSVGANYRAAMHASSKRDFINNLRIVEEECDEVLYWIEIIIDLNLVPENRLRPLHQEAKEILSMVMASILTSRSRLSSSTKRSPKT